jgi:U3 small nucleolar RNA-associated protein 18
MLFLQITRLWVGICVYLGCESLSLALKSISFFLCSSNSGVVNIYNQDSCLQETNPKPIKAVMNLVTGATALTFNPTTEILAIASRKMKEAIRLVIVL